VSYHPNAKFSKLMKLTKTLIQLSGKEKISSFLDK
jgi:hypothetical protein